MDQHKFAQQIEKKSNIEIERLKFMFENLFYTSKGEKKLKPTTTLYQLESIKDALIKAVAIYNERNEEVKALNQEQTAFDIQAEETRNELVDFSKQFKITLPPFLAKLYGI